MTMNGAVLPVPALFNNAEEQSYLPKLAGTARMMSERLMVRNTYIYPPTLDAGYRIFRVLRKRDAKIQFYFGVRLSHARSWGFS